MKSLLYVHKRGNAPCVLSVLLMITAGCFLTLFSVGINTRPAEIKRRPTQTDDLMGYFKTHRAYNVSDTVINNIVPECKPSNCKLPACSCCRSTHPGSFPLREVPMMVMLTFDDHVNTLNYHHLEALFERRWKNPNRCPALFTFFSSDVATEYAYVRKLYDLGHELGSHSVTHRYPLEWWTNASEEDLAKEFVGQREKLEAEASVPQDKVLGIRVPFLMARKDRILSMIQKSGFKFDSSFVASANLVKGDSPWWPYTLDFPPPSLGLKKGYPGVWEVPLNIYDCFNGKGGYFMLDGCPDIKNDTQEVLGYLWRHFAYHYRTRTPMGLFLHVNWFNLNSASRQALIAFLDQLSAMPDVWLLTVSQVINWMEQPTPISQIKKFKPWKC